MTESEVQRFLHAIGEQPELEGRLRAEGADAVAIAAEAGFDFNAEELGVVLGGLSDAELDRVAGGLFGGSASIPRPGGSGSIGGSAYIGDDDCFTTFFAECGG